MIHIALLNAVVASILMADPPAFGWESSPECEQAYADLWDWDVEQTTELMFMNEKLRPFSEGPCATEAKEWQTWISPRDAVRLFDAISTWKHCERRVDEFETWEQCSEVSMPECTNVEFTQRLLKFGFEAPPGCESKAPVCEQVVESTPTDFDACWSSYLNVQLVCGDLKLGAWKASLPECSAQIDECEGAIEAIEKAAVGECGEPYSEILRRCPGAVIEELRDGGNVCVQSVEQEQGEVCHAVLASFQSAEPAECIDAAGAVEKTCATIDYESTAEFQADSPCRRECTRYVGRVSKNRSCRISDDAQSVCISPTQRIELEAQQLACENARERIAKPLIYSSLGVGVVGLGLTVGGGASWFADTAKNPRASVAVTVVGVALVGASIVFGSAAVGLMGASDSGKSGSAQTALRVVTGVLTGSPIRF